MSDGQDKGTDTTGNKSLKPEQKERLRAAIQILIDYLFEDDRLTQLRHVSPKIKDDQIATSTSSTLSETDSL